jgi:quercetin dioxygenase-like cupin family protein
MVNFDELEDIAAARGMTFGEARSPNDQLQMDEIAMSHYRLHPGKRTTFGHRHERAQEFYVVLEGSGRVRLDDEIREIRQGDVIHVAPPVMRAWEAGDDGIVILAAGQHFENEWELVEDFWTD